MRIVEHDALESYSIAGIEHRTLAAARDGLSDLEVWDDLLYPGAATGLCRHDCEKVILVLAGSGQLQLEHEARVFAAPCSLIVPRGRLHGLSNTGDRVMSLITVFAATPLGTFATDGAPVELPWHSALAPGAERPR